MKSSKKFILPFTAALMVGACAPLPAPYEPQRQLDVPAPLTTDQQTILDIKEREDQKEAEAAQAAAAKKKAEDAAAWRAKQASSSAAASLPNTQPSYTPPVAPVKKFYPTAAAAPGRLGYVFNPYTQSLVNVKGIASGRLVVDPNDSDPTHKFRVP